MALVLLLCSELGTPQSAPFLVQREHIPATLSEAAHEELLRNGLHAEIVGEVAERKTECGIVLMDYTGYVDGEVFEMAIRSVEDDLQATSNSTFLNETLRYKRVSEEWNTIMSIITQISKTVTLETSR
ncbi:hypothetical protein COOONC_09315 [Cooperia oncophora]